MLQGFQLNFSFIVHKREHVTACEVLGFHSGADEDSGGV
jgi:hypothetical protein